MRTQSQISTLFKKVHKIERGSALPLGATLRQNGINFAVFSSHATHVTLVLFAPGEDEPIAEIPLDSHINRTGHIWHVFMHGLDSIVRYGYRLDRIPNEAPHIHRFDPNAVLIDPYARSISGGYIWGEPLNQGDEKKMRRRRSMVVEESFDWAKDQPLNIPLSDLVIYEMHARGFTRHESSNVKHPGTFAGIVEKIPYLKKLGVNAVELLPIYEFEESETDRVNPFSGDELLNYWGYQTIGFFAPKASYAAENQQGAQITEFKQMVKALHEAGIELILDVVFNHTAEGDERGITFSLRGIDNSVYYIVDPESGQYANYSGCGNTINCNHPVVRDMIMDCLRYWVTEMHVDGFRFDLASIMGRGRDGEVLANPPLIEHIAADPILANTKLIAEAWDAAGLYQVGTFPAWGRWAEWNGKFRDDMRRFIKGDPGMIQAVTHRLVGSPDLYGASGREPYHSINFITSHDGFTLADLVSYNQKHNEINGENSTDGMSENFSWNCGLEGPTDSSEISSLRERQMRNFVTLLLMSHGVPMIQAGDEIGRTQNGNNNAYCQDNDISWLNWKLAEKNEDLLRFFRILIQFRHDHPSLRRKSYLPGHPEQSDIAVRLHGIKTDQPDFGYESHSIAVQISPSPNTPGDDEQIADIYLAANAYWDNLTFELPSLSHGRKWCRFIDTWLPLPNDITTPEDQDYLDNQESYWVGPRTVIVLIGRKI